MHSISLTAHWQASHLECSPHNHVHLLGVHGSATNQCLHALPQTLRGAGGRDPAVSVDPTAWMQCMHPRETRWALPTGQARCTPCAGQGLSPTSSASPQAVWVAAWTHGSKQPTHGGMLGTGESGASFKAPSSAPCEGRACADVALQLPACGSLSPI